MQKIIIVTVVVVLFVTVFLTLNLVFRQNAKIVENSATYEKRKDMGNLIIINELRKNGIEIIPSTSKEFDSELKQYIGNDDSLFSLVELSKPLAFFIKNNSYKEIVGVSLRWQFTDFEGKSFEIPQSEANPGILMGIKPIDPKMIGKTSLINIKAVKFFTYFNDSVGHRISFANMRFKNPSVNFRTPTNPTQLDVSNLNYQKEMISSNYTNFSVSIDGILFNDGTFIGDNQNLFFETLKAAIQARKDFLTGLTEDKADGKESKQILDDILSKTSNISVNLGDLRNSSLASQEVYSDSYNNYLKNLRDELIMKRSRMSDEDIVEQFSLIRPSEIITLHRVDDSSK